MDIVIPLKRSIFNEELRFALRSIDQNMPHDKLWLAGYKPFWASRQVSYIPVDNVIGHKFKKTANNIRAACLNEKVSDDFLLFNDDFFVMKPVKEFKNMYWDKLINRLNKLKRENADAVYTAGMERTYNLLLELGHSDPLDYGLHIPMIINKHKWLEMWQQLRKLNPNGDPIHLRSFYGNINKLGGEQMDDVKIYEFDQEPTGEETFLSSNDQTFKEGKIGEYVRKMFKERSIYE